MNENWKAIPGWEGLYEASNLGQIKRIAPARGTNAGTVLSSKPRQDGYVSVCLVRSPGNRRSIKVHRLIALTWIGNPPKGKSVVNHKNGIKNDNRVENLEWTDLSGNLRHAFAIGLQPSRSGEGNANARITARHARRIRARYRKESLSAIAESTGMTRANVSAIVNHKTWKEAGGPKPSKVPRKRQVGDPGPSGEVNGQAKLTEVEVREIRRLRALPSGDRPNQSTVAARFRITRSLVSMIENRKVWIHI